MEAENSELQLNVDVLAGIVADIDEDNVHLLEVSSDLLRKIQVFKQISPEINASIQKSARIISALKNKSCSFEKGYKELCSMIDFISRGVEKLDPVEDEIDDGFEESTPAVEDSESEIDVAEEESETGSAAAVISIPENDYLEFETQLDVLECLVEDLSGHDSHVMGVIKDMFGKIGRIESFPSSKQSIVTSSDAAIDRMENGEIEFSECRSILWESVHDLKELLDILHSEADSYEEEDYAGSEAYDSDDDADGDSILAVFLEQQPALLEDLEQDILSLESGKEAALASVMRYIHTLKGETGVLGFLEVQGFLHELESVLVAEKIESVRRKEKISALLSAKDLLLDFVKSVSVGNGEIADKSKFEGVLSSFKSETSSARKRRPRPQSTSRVPKVIVDTSNPELMDFVSETNEYLNDAEIALMALEKNPDDSDNLNEMFRVFHNIKGISGFLNLRDVNELAHNAENLLDVAREGKIRFTGDCADAAYDSIDMFREMVDGVSAALSGIPYKVPEGYVDLLDRLKATLTGQKTEEVKPKAKPAMVETVSYISEPVEIPEQEQEPEQELELSPEETSDSLSAADPVKTPSLKKNIIDGMVKISTSRLDALIDAVGELVIANSMVMQEPEIKETDNPNLSRNASLLGKITRELQELAMSMRMVSVSGTFHKMARVARDLSVKCGTQVEFTFSGEDTELDRNVVEEIGSPLVHMVRNSMDHGIEKPDERKRVGKKEKGRIHLHAYHEGGNVVIRVEDDGKGLDRDAIFEKAVSQGLIKSDADLSDKEVFSFIFNAGFSTAKKVTDVSGRGVGMDVVKKSIENLRGRIEIDSEKGKGTTFFIRLPLTLAIIDGMVVTSGREKYIIPTITIVESLRPEPGQVKTVVGKGEMLQLRGEMIPMFRLYNLFENEGAVDDPANALLVIIAGDGGKRCAVMVDELIDQQQVVIKSLGATFDDVDGVSGGAIMGDGKVSIILDTAGIVRLARRVS